MSRWRFAVLIALFGAPFVFLMATGAYHLWDRGWTFIVSWPMSLCIVSALALAYYWQRKRRLLPKLSEDSIPHGSLRDQEAW